ncbi:acyl-CoA thioesterase [Cesiribacter andamanensis]|uniref:Acyl-CoA thioester hydrolase YbgC n=1 Tax=Cesiribacter andamanensis AMV16 TaxID=1279009 RepID=M7MW52_9BACT|nr:Acyl-CoA thioester hydrolase YbgC [Cesiribacter andamanensis AMV16]
MYIAETTLRVRYAETDQMGYVYYGNYASFYEIGRTEALRSLGFSYRQMEEEMGVMMPVLDLHVQFKAPAYYDDELRVEVRIPELPQTRMRFDYRLYNTGGKLINEGSTTLVFVNKASGRPCRAPEALRTVLEPYYT